jgi:hypothetical protein
VSETVSEEVSVEQPATGHAVVDEVLASLNGLDSLPAAEHVAVFELAQERLRDALSEASDDPSNDPSNDQATPAGAVPTGA